MTRRGHRGTVVIASFTLALGVALGASAWRLHVHGMSRDRTDRVVHEVTRMQGVKMDTIVLSDSVTAGVLFPSKPAPGVQPMATNGFMRLAGQYLLFRRYIEDNSTQRMYLFAHPSLFALDLSDVEGNGLPRYTYVDSVFTRRDERRILAEAGATPKRHIEPRFENLLKSWYPNYEPRPFSLEQWRIVKTEDPPRPDPGPRTAPPLTPQVRYFLGRFEADCRERGIACTIVESPSRPGAPHYDVTVLQKLYPGLRFVDTHDFVSFPAEAFPDTMHLDRASGMHYARALQAHLAPLFDDRMPPWDGKPAAFGQAESLPLVVEGLHVQEPWGAWASRATVRIRFTAAKTLEGGEFRVQMRIPPQPTAEGVPVSLWFDGEKRAEQVFPPNLDLREVVVKPGKAVAAGSAHVIEIRIPRTINQLKLGISGDGRDLGPGIASVAYCAPGDC